MNKRHLRNHNAGFTIIELMIAMILGLLISGAVGALFLQGSRSHSEDDRFLRMVENGRFAIDTIAEDLRMITFWGETIDPGAVTTTLVAGEDCGLNLFSGNDAVSYNNPNSSPAVTQFDITSGSCPTQTGTVRSNTTQLAIKHTVGAGITASQANNTVYLRSNGTVGSLIQFQSGTTTAPAAGFADWLYRPSIYYIQDSGGTPFLCRLTLNGLGFNAVGASECLAEGVEHLNVQFGIDTDTDGVANQYKSNPTAAEMQQAVSARIYVLVRSVTPDQRYDSTKSYVLGDLNVAAANDNFYRKVFSTTLQLRNPANLALLN